MSILIKGIEMPHHGMVINIYADGRVTNHFDEILHQIGTAVPVPDSPDAEDGAALHNIKDAHINLCDSCEHLFPECPAGRDDALFGNYDNVCACAKYRCGPEGEA
ncbi:MAG: hypothetical protein J6Y20_01300 [Lachnospiraceae bacterium]|nr:hypothetical protein [Lachnospiraceae bacterium]